MNSHTVLYGLILGAIAAILSVIAFIGSGLGFIAMWDTILHAGFPFLIALAIATVIAFIAGLGEDDGDHGTLVGIGAFVVLAIIGGIFVGAFRPYYAAKGYLDEVTTIEDTTSYADRAPWIVAETYGSRDQGDVIGDRDGMHYVPAPQNAEAADGKGTSRYTALVRDRSALGMAGYQAIQTMEMPTTGNIPKGASTYCDIPSDMDKKLGMTWPWHSLSWSIHAQKANAHYDKDDAYGYCQGADPVIVVPLWKYEGFLNPRKVPDGAAVYTTDGLRILSAKQLVSEKIQGPTYPRSVAVKQREALNAGSGLSDWWGSRYGYDPTTKTQDAKDSGDEQSEEDKEAVDDANAENATEFTMISTDGQMQYVTPLTPRGSSESIVAISAIPAQQGTDAGIILNTSTDLPATSTIETAVKESSVNGDDSWATRWSSGMGVYEILPGQDGHWVASIGQGQAVSYRADIAPDGTVVVTNSVTGQSSNTPDTGAETEAPAEEQPTGTASSGKPLSEMTEAELLETIQKATEELQKREQDSQGG